MSSTTEGYPDNNPKTVFGLAKLPMHSVPAAAIRSLAEALGDGVKKYGLFNWRSKKVSATVYYAAAMRHLTDWYDRTDANDEAPDSKIHHLKHAMACLAIILDTMGTELMNDDRPPGVPPQLDTNQILGIPLCGGKPPAPTEANGSFEVAIVRCKCRALPLYNGETYADEYSHHGVSGCSTSEISTTDIRSTR